MKTVVAAFAMLSVAAGAGAQVVVHESPAKASAEQHLQVIMEKAPNAAVHLTVEAQAVAGAPYSGEAVTETVQTLADGNRIVRRTVSRVYRDGKGRTRRETIGPDGQVTSVLLSDPAGGKSYVFDPASNTLRHAGVATFIPSAGGRGEGAAVAGVAIYHVSEQAKEAPAKPTAHDAPVKPHASAGVAAVGPLTWTSAGSERGTAAHAESSSTTESLGERTFEGVAAKGSRTTTVIPAGAIGNEQPITVVSEEWFSPDLKVLVMTRHIDPRAGETTYQLNGILRGEPAPSLFEPPAGVTVK